MFVPRTSVKKLVLKPKGSPAAGLGGSGIKATGGHPVTFAPADSTHNVSAHNITNDEDGPVANLAEESVAFPLKEVLKDKNQIINVAVSTSTPKAGGGKAEQDSFSDLKTRKKSAAAVLDTSTSPADTR